METAPPGLAFPRQVASGEFFHNGTTEDKFGEATPRVSRNENLVIGAQLSNESSQHRPWASRAGARDGGRRLRRPEKSLGSINLCILDFPKLCFAYDFLMLSGSTYDFSYPAKAAQELNLSPPPREISEEGVKPPRHKFLSPNSWVEVYVWLMSRG